MCDDSSYDYDYNDYHPPSQNYKFETLNFW